MIENLPAYISITFILTTFACVILFIFALKQANINTIPAKIFLFLLSFGLIFQMILSLGGFYLKTDALPPRLLLIGVFPAFLLIVIYFIFTRRSFIERLPLKTLTFLHVVRVPVEIVLFWLFQEKMIPEVMTFEDRNFDILAGLTAPFIALLGFRGGKINRPLLIIWNILALGLLTNIVTTAILSFPFPFQQIAFEQPNRAVLYFPFVWLPTIVVPLVLFSHLISLWQLLTSRTK